MICWNIKVILQNNTLVPLFTRRGADILVVKAIKSIFVERQWNALKTFVEIHILHICVTNIPKAIY